MISFDLFLSGLPLTHPFSIQLFFDIILFLDKVVLVAIIPSSSYFKETSFTWDRTGGDPITQGNRNPLLYKNIGADGIKTGFLTVEQYSLESSIKVNKRRIID